MVALTAQTFAARPLSSMAPPVTTILKSRFCISSGATWKLQNYAPLIDTRRGTRFVQAISGETSTSRILVKSFDQRTSLTFDYKFNQQGKLVAFHGTLHRWGHWIVDANLLPEVDVAFRDLDANYRLSDDGPLIQRPDDSGDYTSVFHSAPVYQTLADVPCAWLFQEAEKQEKR